jgi:hypothetical protein
MSYPPPTDFEKSLSQLWRRYQDLLVRKVEWKSLSHGARSKLTRDLEAFFAESKEFDKVTSQSSLSKRDRQNAWFWLSAVWSLIAGWNLDRGKTEKATELYWLVFSRDPTDGNALVHLVTAMIRNRQFAEAAELVDSVSKDIFTQEDGSNAAQIIQLAMQNDEFAAALSGERLKHCARCISQGKTQKAFVKIVANFVLEMGENPAHGK